MGCASGKQKKLYIDDETFKFLNSNLKPTEVTILQLIYNDLSERIKAKQLNLENFLLFFHKNGFWGERLFKQFVTGESNLISMKEFIKGIVKIFKISQKKKIQLLYSFFAQQDTLGISFNKFIVVLYNYPKQDLQLILDDKEFIEKQFKKSLKLIRNKKQLRRDQSEEIEYKIDDSQDSEMNMQTEYGFKSVIEEVQKRRSNQKESSFKVKLDGRNVELHTFNIQHLVKKFARKLFKEYNIKQTTGRLTEQQFSNWIEGHKNLYDNYYNGFHNLIWEQNPLTGIPRYLETSYDYSSPANYLQPQRTSPTHIYMIGSTLLVTQPPSLSSQQPLPLYTICLDGLEVKKIFREQYGFGISISHHDGIYNTKQFFFKDQEITLRWVQVLKYFRGSSLQQRLQLLQLGIWLGKRLGLENFLLSINAFRNGAIGNTQQRFMISQLGLCAVKQVIESSKLDSQARQLIAHQSSIMSILNHPLLVQYKESIQTKTHLYIITELVKGSSSDTTGKDLFDLIRSSPKSHLSEFLAANIIRQLLIGVKYLHSLDIIHRDLKPQNIMIIQQSQTLKIIDFGFSNYASSLQQCDTSQLLGGTPGYIAPQILKNQPITRKVDNFAIGAIMYFVLSGTMPFGGKNIQEIVYRTLEASYDFDGRAWRSVSMEAKDLINRLLMEEPQQRISIDESLCHVWFKNTNSE